MRDCYRLRGYIGQGICELAALPDHNNAAGDQLGAVPPSTWDMIETGHADRVDELAILACLAVSCKRWDIRRGFAGIDD